MGISHSKTSFEITRVIPIMNLNVLISGNMRELDARGVMIRSYEAVIRASRHRSFISTISGVCIF